MAGEHLEEDEVEVQGREWKAWPGQQRKPRAAGLGVQVELRRGSEAASEALKSCGKTCRPESKLQWPEIPSEENFQARKEKQIFPFHAQEVFIRTKSQRNERSLFLTSPSLPKSADDHRTQTNETRSPV